MDSQHLSRHPREEYIQMGAAVHAFPDRERLVYTEIFEQFEETGGESLVTMTLEEHDGQTTLTSTTIYRSKEVRDAVVRSGMEDGAAESFDRLAEHLADLLARG